jgi:spermidine/putrescine-binding protein
MTDRTHEGEPTLGARLERARLSRFELLKKGGVTALVLSGAPALLAACGGSSTEEAASPAPPASTEPAASPEPAAAPPAAAPQASGTLDFLSWEGYDFPDDGVPAMKAWKDANGVTLKSTYIGSHDDIQAKIKSGGGKGVDLITYYQGYKPLYRELNLLAPLDPEKIPNLANLFPFFASDESNFWIEPDGSRTGAPMFWGALGITYDSSVVTTPPDTYDVLFEPKYKGKVTMSDDPVGAYTQAAHILGIDVSQMTQDDFKKVTDWLKELIKQTKGVAPSYGDATTRLVAGDANISFLGWAAMNSFAKDAGKDTVLTVLPKEGGYSFCDSYAIPPTSDNVDSAHAWIDEGLDAKVNAEAANYLVGGTTCAPSVANLKPDIAALYDYANIDTWFDKAPLYNNPPVKSDQYVTVDKVIAAWQELKASA